MLFVIEWDRFVGIDSFESIYFLKSNALFKKNNQGIQNFRFIFGKFI
jgi:hypothetical protein